MAVVGRGMEGRDEWAMMEEEVVKDSDVQFVCRLCLHQLVDTAQ